MLHNTWNGAWNVSGLNQGDLEVVKQEVGRLNLVVHGVSEPNWTGNYEAFHSEKCKVPEMSGG